MEESDKFLQEQHSKELARMPPVLMGVASAAIGFAFHETADRTLSWTLLPILVAVIAWGVSFACGVLQSEFSARITKANLGLNWAIRNNYEPGRKEAQELFDEGNNRNVAARRGQQWLLLFGAAAYLAGHIWHLAEAAAP